MRQERSEVPANPAFGVGDRMSALMALVGVVIVVVVKLSFAWGAVH